jgi:hypothetical protein
LATTAVAGPQAIRIWSRRASSEHRELCLGLIGGADVGASCSYCDQDCRQGTISLHIPTPRRWPEFMSMVGGGGNALCASICRAARDRPSLLRDASGKGSAATGGWTRGAPDLNSRCPAPNTLPPMRPMPRRWHEQIAEFRNKLSPCKCRIFDRRAARYSTYFQPRWGAGIVARWIARRRTPATRRERRPEGSRRLRS